MKHTAQIALTSVLIAGLAIAPAYAQSQSQPQSSARQTSQAAAQSANQNSPAYVPAPAARRQQVPQRPARVLRSESSLVRIDVEVTDHSGKPIKGLTPDQFIVTDDGKQQKLSFFTYEDIEKIDKAGPENANAKPIVIPVDSPTPVPDEQITGQTRDRRMLVLFFDMSSMGNEDLRRARIAAEKFISAQMSPADLVSVVTYGTDLSVWCDFTNQKEKIHQALERLKPGAAADLSTNAYATAQEGEYDVSGYTGAAYTPDETEFNVFNTDQKLAAIEGLSNVLADIPGRKDIIEFTSGITQTGEENRTELRAATDAANRADVSIYSIDARGLYTAPPGGDATTDTATGTSMFSGAAVFQQSDQRQDSRDTLSTLSGDTGGKTFFDLGDLSDAFPEIQKDNSGYYLIGYYLGSDVKHDGSWRAIHVKVKVPGARVRFRNGYYAPRDFQHLEEADRDQQLDDAIHSQDPIVELPIAVETGMFRIGNNQVYVPIDAKLSATALEWAQKHGKREAVFDFAAEVRAQIRAPLAAKGASFEIPVAQLRDTITVHLDPERFEEISKANLEYQGGVVLAPGNYDLKFVAREDESGKIGTFEEPLVVPPLANNKLSLSSMMLSSQVVPVEQSLEVKTKTEGLKAKLAESPLEVNGERIVPSVTRYFTQGQTLYVFFQAYYPAKQKFDAGSLRAGLIFFRGGLQVNATPLFAPTQIDAKARAASFRVSLPLSKLPTGRYAVQAIVIGAGTQQAAFGRSYLALAEAAPGPNLAAPAPAQPNPQK
jgi:VWFA-related protein